MKKVIISIVSGLMVLVAVAVVSTTRLAETPAGNFEKHKDMTVEQILENLKSLPKDDFTKVVKYAFDKLDGKDSDGAIVYGSGLRERINEYSEDELISLIKDKNNDLLFRITLVQLYFSDSDFENRTEKGSLAVRELLFDSNVEDSLKGNIITLCNFSDESGNKILHTFAVGDNDILAFKAIKKMNKTNSSDAVEVARSVLKDYDSQSPEKINAAMKTMSRFFRTARINNNLTGELIDEKHRFIEICKKITETAGKNEKLHDAAVVALSDMTDTEAITAIVESDNIDEAFKSYAIEQNYLTLKSMLISGTEAEIEVVCKAMNIYPVKELREQLLNCNINGNALLNQSVNKAISKIDSEGTNADKKWEILYYEED